MTQKFDLPMMVSSVWYIDSVRQTWPNCDASLLRGAGSCKNSMSRQIVRTDRQ